jgi:hypothetical protein
LVLLISIFLIFFIILELGEEIDVSVEIATWKNNASGAATFSFDDGYLETYESVIPLLNGRGVRGTFNIITSRVGGRYGELELADWQRWRDASEREHEIASHTHTHIHVDEIPPSQLEDDLETSKKSIKHHVGIDALSFVYPGGAYAPQSRDVVEGFFISARTSDDGFNNASPNMHLLKSKTAASFNAFKMNAWADKAEKDGFWLVENLHLVSDENPTGYSFYLSTEEFKNHLDYLISKNLWIAPQENVAKYIIERASTNINTVSANRFFVILSKKTPMDTAVFDEPLTLMAEIPGWESMMVISGWKKVEKNDLTKNFFVDVKPSDDRIFLIRLPGFLASHNAE